MLSITIPARVSIPVRVYHICAVGERDSSLHLPTFSAAATIVRDTRSKDRFGHPKVFIPDGLFDWCNHWSSMHNMGIEHRTPRVKMHGHILLENWLVTVGTTITKRARRAAGLHVITTWYLRKIGIRWQGCATGHMGTKIFGVHRGATTRAGSHGCRGGVGAKETTAISEM